MTELSTLFHSDQITARKRLWSLAATLAAGERQITEETKYDLKADLSTLGMPFETFLQDVASLKWLAHVEAEDPCAEIAAAQRQLDVRAVAAVAHLEEAKSALAVAESNLHDLQAHSAALLDAMGEAQTAHRQQRQKAAGALASLRSRGYTGEPLAKPPVAKLVRARVLEECYVEHVLRRAGDIVEVPEDMVGGPIGGLDAPVPESKEEPALLPNGKVRPPSWTTAGHIMEANDAEGLEQVNP
jgi:hypothetical protein